MFSNNLSIDKTTFTSRILNFIALFSSIIIVIFVLYSSPNPGVADQGDFQRVMTVSGLKEISNVPNADEHWFKYVTTKYDYSPLSPWRMIGVIPTTSMIYPIMLSRFICKLSNLKYYDTRVLSLVYSLIYIIGLFICIKSLDFHNRLSKLFLILFSVFVIFDGNYLVWFNSIYGEAMIIASLLLFIAATLYFAKNYKTCTNRMIFFIFISIYLFLGAKMQCFSSFPILAIFFFRIYSLHKRSESIFHRKNNVLIPLIILLFYIGGIYVQINSTCGIDTQYNSVFYGILKNSDDPKADLASLGLPSDMAVETGKHAYLPKEQYIKYTPGSDLTKSEFNRKISNLKLLIFYLKQPDRFIDGMKYTASRSFDTGGSLGKFEKSSGIGYVYKLNRFTFWSNFRASKLPKSLFFIITFYLILIIVSIIEYKKSFDTSVKLRIELLWVIILIGLVQFPMPYIGNGEADTSKQLFLFNFTFDLSIITSVTYVFDKICNFIKADRYRFSN